MKVLFSPQFSDEWIINYSFNGNIINVEFIDITGTHDIVTDTFDFNDLPDGQMQISDEIQTTLPIAPILTASKENGIVSVELLAYIDEDATHEEKFPNWLEV